MNSSSDFGMANQVSIEDEINSSGIVLKERRAERTRDRHDSTSLNATTSDSPKKICLITKLQSVFFPMKLFGLYFEDSTNPSSRLSVLVKRLYQCFDLLVLWLNVGKTLAAFWVGDDLLASAGVTYVLWPPLLWNLQTALQGSICFFTMRITSKKSSLKSLMLYWNSQPNFHELVTEPFMIKCIKRTLLVVYVVMAFNAVFYALNMFLPSESLNPYKQSLVSPFSSNSTVVRVVFCVISLYCTAAWLMPFAIFTAVCLTLIHQCRRLRKTLRLTASTSEIRRVIILRQQHASLCGSVRRVDNLFKFLTLVVYITNMPLVCFLLYELIFKSCGVPTQLTLSFWFVTVSFIMGSVSFLGAHLNNKVSEYSVLSNSKILDNPPPQPSVNHKLSSMNFHSQA